MDKIKFQLVTPEKTVFSDELDSLSCPTVLGQITILPNHIPLVANLKSGELIARKADKEEYINVTGGFVEIRPNNEVIVLADAAEHHYEIDQQRAEEARLRAATTLKEKRLSEEEYAKVAASLERNLARLRITRRRGRQKGAPITGEAVFKE